MKRKRTPVHGTIAALLASLALWACGGGRAGSQDADLHRQAIIVDTHIDTPQRLLDEGFEMGPRDPYGHFDIPRAREGGLDAAFFSIWVDADVYTNEQAVPRALRQIATVYEQVERHPEDLTLATSAAEIRRAHGKGKIALLMGLEGGHMIADDLRILRTYAELGVRYMTLTHNVHTSWADSSRDEPAHNGLTDFGQQVVREMNRLGIMVDISHVSQKTLYDALEVTQAPVIASHSSCRALTDIHRNLTDEQLRAVAENGGVVQVAFGSWFVEPTYDAFYNSVKDERTRRRKEIDQQYPDDPARAAAEKYKLDKEILGPAQRGTLKTLADHIEHVIKVAGIDHVGYGSDFDGVSSLPGGMGDVSQLPRLTQELADRGYSDEDIRKILGENTLRVMAEVEKVAARLQVR